MALKKARILSKEQRQLFIEKNNSTISIRRQCEWIGFNRSNLYYQSREQNIEFEDQLRKAIVIFPRKSGHKEELVLG